MQSFVAANQLVTEAEAWYQATFLEPEDGAERLREKYPLDGCECNHTFGKVGSGGVPPPKGPLCFLLNAWYGFDRP